MEKCDKTAERTVFENDTNLAYLAWYCSLDSDI